MKTNLLGNDHDAYIMSLVIYNGRDSYLRVLN